MNPSNLSQQPPGANSEQGLLIPSPAPRNHGAQDNHPSQKHGPDNPKRKHSQPALTHAILLQPRERIHRYAVILVVVDVATAVAVDVALGAEELDRGLDYAGDVEDEEDEGADHHEPREEAALVDEEDHDEDEEDGEGADCYSEGHDPVVIQSVFHHSALALGCHSHSPRYPQPRIRLTQLILVDHEAREDTNQRPTRREHDDDPEVELLIRPVVRLPHHDSRPRDGPSHAGSSVGRRGGGVVREDGREALRGMTRISVRGLRCCATSVSVPSAVLCDEIRVVLRRKPWKRNVCFVFPFPHPILLYSYM